MAVSILRSFLMSEVIRASPITKTTSMIKYRPWQPFREMHRKSIYKTEKAKEIRFYVLHRYLEYLKNYDKVLERSFKGAMKVYRVFSVGVLDFIKDLKNFRRIIKIINNAPSKNRFLSLNRREIELYHQMPRDMRKVAPVLLISALPFANYVVFPLAYLFPRHLLTSHFWTLQQKSEFNIMDLQKRLMNNRPVFRCVQAELDTLQSHKLYNQWSSIIAKLGSGTQPNPEEIVACKQLFMEKPYHLFYLKRNHVKLLLKAHDLHVGWFRRTRLHDRAVILKEMDKAILREGGVHNLPLDALKTCCFIRGLNPTNMRTEDMITWLNKWMIVSKAVDKECLSLLLHCPILLGYNEPTNWLLIYGKK